MVYSWYVKAQNGTGPIQLPPQTAFPLLGSCTLIPDFPLEGLSPPGVFFCTDATEMQGETGYFLHPTTPFLGETVFSTV